MHHLRTAGFVSALAATFLMGGFILPNSPDQSGPNLFQDVVSLVSNRYIDTLEVADVYERAAQGLVDRLDDPYADLYTPEEVEEFTMAYEGHYAGVGMLIELRQGSPVVLRIFPNTPAERHGVRLGDRVLSIDGQPVEGWPLERVANSLKGEPGSTVEVQFRRYGVERALAVDITRAVVRIPAVPYATLVDDEVGYIPLIQFNETAAGEVATAVGDLLDQGATGVVLDLRGNGGGILEQAIWIADMFLPPGVPVARQWERGAEDTYYRSENDALAPDLPMVVLLDETSASASEIVAGALQDHDRAVVIGTRSFGKGLVQTAYGLDGGYVFKMTTGKWYTPSGRSIHRERSLVDGRLVEVEDSVHFGIALDERPVYHSSGGRLVYGGGGITPDLEAVSDTLSSAEQALAAALLPHSPDFNMVVFDLAEELQDGVGRDFVVTPEWRDQVYRRLLDRGVDLDRDVFDAGGQLIDRELAIQVGRLAFGEEYAMVRHVERDAVLRRAIQVIRTAGPDQGDLFTYVQREKDRG